MLGATAPNTGARSSDCGSTCHSLMKAQRNGAEDSAKRGAVLVSFSTTDCLRISVMSNNHQNCYIPDIQTAFATREC